MEGSHLPVEAGESQWCTHCCCSTGRVPLQLHVSSTGVKCFAVGVLGGGSLSLSQPSHSSEEWPVAKLGEGMLYEEPGVIGPLLCGCW